MPVSPPNPKVVAAVDSVITSAFDGVITSAFGGILFDSANTVTR